MQRLGLVEYRQPSDIKRTYPNIIITEVFKEGHVANGLCTVSKTKDIVEFVKRYKSMTVSLNQFPKIFKELGLEESDMRYWIPTKIKIFEDVDAILRSNNKLLNRLTNVTPNTELVSKPNRFLGERGITTTPCVGICTTTNCGDDVCRGCGRTAHQVINWNQYSDAEKATINRLLRK